MALDPIADVLRAHDAGLVLVSGSLECPGHVLLPWLAHAALRRGGGGGGIGGASAPASPSALIVLAAAHPPSAHAAALRKVQQQQQQQLQQLQQQQTPLPVIYVEPRFPGPDDEDEDEEDEGEGGARRRGGRGGSGGGGGGWLRRLSCDLASAVRRQAEAAAAATASSSASAGPGIYHRPPAQITVLVDSLTVLAAAADAGGSADGPGPSSSAPAAAVCAPRPPRAHLNWLAFLHGLVSLEARAPLARVRVVALCADDVPDDAAWRRWLRHRCAALLTLSPVEGRMAGLDGELRAEARAAPAAAGDDGVGQHAGALFAPGAAAAAGGPGGWRGGSGGGAGGGWAAAADGWGAGRCFFRASELSVRWVSDVQGADLMR